MGLFSSKKKKKFFTAIQRMVEDKDIVPSGKSAVMRYIFEGGLSTSITSKSLPDYLIEAAQNNMPSKYKRGYRYVDKGDYVYGLPKAASSRDAVDVPAKVKEILELELGTSINLLYGKLEEANYYHFMWKILIEDYGYNPTTNELENLTAVKGFTCYLTSAQIHYCNDTMQAVLDSTYFDQWGLSADFGQTIERSQDLNRPQLSYLLDTAATKDYALVQYEYLEIIPDTTPPVDFKTTSFDGLVLKGVAEIGATVKVYDVTDVLLTSAITDEDGYCEITLASAETAIKIKVVDTALNESGIVDIVAPYEDLTDFGTGDEPTQTEFKREENFTFDFLAYIQSNHGVGVEPVDPGETPPVIADDDYVPEHNYIMACYTYDNAGITEIRFFTYVFGSGLNPEFEDIIQYSEASGEFFPRLYARLNGNDLSQLPKTDPIFKTSTKLGKHLGIGWEGWVKQLHASIEDVGTVQQLFMTLAAPVNTTDVVICEYLYRYFYKLYDEQPEAPVGFVPPLGEAFNTKEGLSLGIADSAYAHHIEFSAIGFNTVTGSIGEVGHYTSTYVPESTTTVREGLRIRRVVLAAAYHSIKWQVTSTEYQEVRVYQLSSAHRFSGGGTSVSGTDEALVIPLDRSIIPRMTTPELEILFGKCLYLFINVVKIIKVKWYQRGVFKVVMAVVAIVISVVSVGAGAPISAYLLAAAQAVALGVAVSLAVQVLSKVLVKLGVSVEAVAILATVVAVIAVFAGDGSSLAEVLNTSAKTLLQASNAAFQLASSMSSLQLMETVKQMEAFQAEAKSKWELLEEAQKLLDTGIVPLSLETLMSDLRSKVLIRLGESPEVFLTRTVGLGNVGTLAFDMVSNYVDSALVLPDLNTMMRQTQRG